MEKVALVESRSSTLHKIAKVLSYFTIIAPLSLLIAKAVLRSSHTYKVFNARKHLEKGINVSDATVVKIQKLMPKIVRANNDNAIEWLSKGNNLVFRLKDDPTMVYKVAPAGNVIRGSRVLTPEMQITERFDNMVKAQEICMAEQLDLLTIPHAKKFEVMVDGKKQLFLAEESLDFPAAESAHEALFADHAESLKKTTLQLAALVAKTGFNDVTWRNIPVINEAPGYQGPRRVALIDLEHMTSAKNGFIGDANGSRGLIRCVSADQIDLVIEEGRKNGIRLSEKAVIQTKELRLKELAENQVLNAFYAKKGIKTGKELLDVDLSTLGLDLDATAEYKYLVAFKDGKPELSTMKIALRKVTEDVIAALNQQLLKQKDDESLKGKRYILLDTNENPLNFYRHLGLPEGVGMISEENEKKIWLNQIIKALIEKGHLFKLVKVNGHGFFIQA